MSSRRQPLARTRAVALAIAAFLVLGAAIRTPRPAAPILGRSNEVSAKQNIAAVSVESQSKATVTILVYTTKSARITVGKISARITSDTLQLRTPTSFTADLSNGEVHLVAVDGSALDVTAVFTDSPASRATAHFGHVILKQGGTGVSSGLIDVASEVEPYFEFQVQKPVAQIPGTGSPAYPAALRAARVEGEVQAQFVVNEKGNVELNTLKLLNVTNDLFAAAVRTALPAMRFHPAEARGKHVRQLVQQSFQFKLAGRRVSGRSSPDSR